MRVFWRVNCLACQLSGVSAVVLLLGVGGATGLRRAQTPEATLTCMTMDGTIGPYRVGLTSVNVF